MDDKKEKKDESTTEIEHETIHPGTPEFQIQQGENINDDLKYGMK